MWNANIVLKESLEIRTVSVTYHMISSDYTYIKLKS